MLRVDTGPIGPHGIALIRPGPRLRCQAAQWLWCVLPNRRRY
jgi:hypothetical protein